MANAHEISHDMQVFGSDGGMVGRVDGVEGGRIKLKRAPDVGGEHHHYIPLAWIARVDDHVHLTESAVAVRDHWTVADDGRNTRTAARAEGVRSDAYSRRNSNWLIWVAVALLVIVALYALISGLGYAS